MRWIVVTLLVLASIAFVASSASFVLAPRFTLAHVAPLLNEGAASLDFAEAPAMARPAGAALRLLLMAVWVAVLAHAARAVLAERRIGAIVQRRGSMRQVPHTAVAHGWFIVALTAGTIWPWTACLPGHWTDVILASVMMTAALWAALERRRRQQVSPIFTGTVEVFAGWATVAVYASFASMLAADLNVSVALAAVVSVLLLMVTVVEVQLRLGNAVAYGLAVIWALIGIASVAVPSDLTVSTAAIAAIAAIAAVLVRVMS